MISASKLFSLFVLSVLCLAGMEHDDTLGPSPLGTSSLAAIVPGPVHTLVIPQYGTPFQVAMPQPSKEDSDSSVDKEMPYYYQGPETDDSWYNRWDAAASKLEAQFQVVLTVSSMVPSALSPTVWQLANVYWNWPNIVRHWTVAVTDGLQHQAMSFVHLTVAVTDGLHYHTTSFVHLTVDTTKWFVLAFVDSTVDVANSFYMSAVNFAHALPSCCSDLFAHTMIYAKPASYWTVLKHVTDGLQHSVSAVIDFFCDPIWVYPGCINLGCLIMAIVLEIDVQFYQIPSREERFRQRDQALKRREQALQASACLLQKRDQDVQRREQAVQKREHLIQYRDDRSILILRKRQRALQQQSQINETNERHFQRRFRALQHDHAILQRWHNSLQHRQNHQPNLQPSAYPTLSPTS